MNPKMAADLSLMVAAVLFFGTLLIGPTIIEPLMFAEDPTASEDEPLWYGPAQPVEERDRSHLLFEGKGGWCCVDIGAF